MSGLAVMVALLLAAPLGGCGQKGPLTLPKPAVQASAPAPPTAASAVAR